MGKQVRILGIAGRLRRETYNRAALRAAVITLLNQHLADTFDLYSRAKQAHWNVKGAQFFQTP